MAWTKEKPKIGGYYWVKAAGDLTGKEYIHPVHVYRSNRHLEFPNMVFSDGENFNINHSLFKEWWDQQITTQTEEEYFRTFILNNWNRERIINFAKYLLY
jgi:hypothetical protein